MCPAFEVFSVLSADLRIVTPDFLAGVRVKGNYLAVWGTHIQHAVDFQRGVLGGCFAGIAFTRDVTGAECPGWYQLVGILRGDFFQRRVTVTKGGTTVGLPVTIGHGRCSVGHARYGITVQLAFDFTRAGELAGQCSQTGQHYGNAQCAGGNRCRLTAQDRATEPWQQQDDTDGEPHGQAWHQLPPVQTDFHQCPYGAGEQYQCVQGQCCAAPGNQQCARQAKTDPGQQVVPRPAQRDQFDTPGQHGQAH